MKHVAAVLLLALAKKEISNNLFNTNQYLINQTKQTSTLPYLQSESNPTPLLLN